MLPRQPSVLQKTRRLDGSSLVPPHTAHLGPVGGAEGVSPTIEASSSCRCRSSSSVAASCAFWGGWSSQKKWERETEGERGKTERERETE